MKTRLSSSPAGGDVCRQYGLDDEDDDLDQGGTDQHQADDGNLPEADLFAFCPGCGRIRCGCIRRRFFDEEDQDDKVEEQAPAARKKDMRMPKLRPRMPPKDGGR